MSSPGDFFDEARVFVEGGKGGDGAVHFRREKFVPLGGPDGGDGGTGGSVVFKADRTLNTLQSFRYKRRFSAPNGNPGTGNRKHGRGGADVMVRVPTGTVVWDDDTGEKLADLRAHGGTFVAAQGGQGGLGNQHFATSTRQAPAFAEKGEPGRERWLNLELKLVADVGLVGLPNAGKSTLLASMSAARPKIADYPFTTIVPNLGVVATDDDAFVMADIPGLIEGAHQGHGLGDRFLRHIERTRLLVRVVDGSSADPISDFEQVTEELRQYDPELLTRPQIVALSKMDLPDAADRAEEVSLTLAGMDVPTVAVSGVTHEGIAQLAGAILSGLQACEPRFVSDAPEAEEVVYTTRPDPNQFSVERRRGTFYVHGQRVERIAAMTDMESAEGLERMQRQLKRLGVLQKLEEEGVRAGSTVDIAGYRLVWEGEFEPSVSPTAKPGARKASGSRRRSSTGTDASQGHRQP